MYLIIYPETPHIIIMFLKYNTGFGNEFATEALPDALPVLGNNPQKCPYNLYAEQLSGTAFTAPRGENQRTWFYRIQPSVLHTPFEPVPALDSSSSSSSSSTSFKSFGHGDLSKFVLTPNQLRWNPIPEAENKTTNERTFMDGILTMMGEGNPMGKDGLAIHMYSFGKSMENDAMQNADGDFLIVPQTGTLVIKTECGIIEVPPKVSRLRAMKCAKLL